jgi:AraC-like DNA-binding protein
MLRLALRYVSPAAGLVVDTRSIRRAEFVFRKTAYRRVVVDERLLTRSFPVLRSEPRLQVFIVLDGRMTIEHLAETHEFLPGEAWLVDASTQDSARFEDATFLDFEWSTARSRGVSVARPMLLDRPDPARVASVAAALEGTGQDAAREIVDDVLSLLAAIGAPIDAPAAALAGGPTIRDERLARALERQLASLRTDGSTLHLSDGARLSPRHLQRVVREFNRRYAVNAGNWRDTRNRWRMQLAAVLLSIPDLSIASVAEEVGYGSGASLARAFANAGFPPPAELRERLRAG